MRLDLFGDEVDRLGSFDVADQRTSAEVDEAWLFSCREFVPDEAQRSRAGELADRLPWAASARRRIEEGELFDGMEGWLGLLSPELGLLPDGLELAGVVLLEPRRLRDRALELLEEERALVETLLDTWSEGTGAGGLDPEGGLHLDFDRLLAECSAPVLALPTVPESPQAPQLAVGSFEQVVGDAERLAAHLRSLVARKMTVVAVGATEQSARRLSELLAAEGLEAPLAEEIPEGPGIVVVVAALGKGVLLPEQSLAILAESDITGRRAPHRVARAQPRVADGFFDDLAVGSYVVHRQHGVARFAGVTTRTLAGATRDYLILEFRGDDKLYLPVDQIDAITPYSGGDAPSLSKMGGSDWQRTRAKARAAASEVAEELVSLYRARLVATGHAFGPDTPWQEEMETWASARRRSRSAPPSRRSRTTSRWLCWCPRPCLPLSTTRRSWSASAAIRSMWRS